MYCFSSLYSILEPFGCPIGFTRIDYGCYMVDIQPGLFDAKMESCKAKGGYLTKIDTAEEILAVKDFITGCRFFILILLFCMLLVAQAPQSKWSLACNGEKHRLFFLALALHRQD